MEGGGREKRNKVQRQQKASLPSAGTWAEVQALCCEVSATCCVMSRDVSLSGTNVTTVPDQWSITSLTSESSLLLAPRKERVPLDVTGLWHWHTEQQRSYVM